MGTANTDHPGNVPSMPVAVNILSSTNTSPIAVTTSTPHGAETGEFVMIVGHLTNTAANGSWRVIRISATQVQLVGSTGSGVGGATGTLHDQCFGSAITVPADGDDPTGTVFATPSVGLQDRTAWLNKTMSWERNVYPGGVDSIYGQILIKDGGFYSAAGGSTTEFAALSYTTWNNGAVVLVEGDFTFNTASTTIFDDGADFFLDGEFTVRATGRIVVKDSGYIQLEDGAIFEALSGAMVKINAGANENVFGTLTVRDDGQFTLATGSLADFNGEIERRGALNLVGDDACTGLRYQKFDGEGDHIDGDQGLSFEAHRFDRIHVPALTDNRVWRFKTPTNSFQAQCAHLVTVVRPNNTDNELTIRDDDSNDELAVFPAGTSAGIFACFIWDPEDQKWKFSGGGVV